MTKEVEEIRELKVRLGLLGCVYLWTLKGKPVYVGQTYNLEKRNEQHLRSARNGSNKPLHRLIRQNREEDFEVCVLFTSLSQDELYDKESLYIYRYKTLVSQGGCNSVRSPGTRNWRMRKQQEKYEAEHREVYFKNLRDGRLRYGPGLGSFPTKRVAIPRNYKLRDDRREQNALVRVVDSFESQIVDVGECWVWRVGDVYNRLQVYRQGSASTLVEAQVLIRSELIRRLRERSEPPGFTSVKRYCCELIAKLEAEEYEEERYYDY